MFNVSSRTVVPGFNVQAPGFRVGSAVADTGDWRVVLAGVKTGVPGPEGDGRGNGWDRQPASNYPNSSLWYRFPPFPNLRTADNCPEIIENCRRQCTDRCVAGTLAGARGPDAPLVLRRCIRDCVAPSGCNY